MDKKKLKTTQDPKKLSPRANLLLALALVIVLPLAVWGVMELAYQQKVNTLKNEVTKVWQDVVKPNGGAELNSYVDCSHVIHDITDHTCPTASTSWFVLVDPSEAEDLASKTLNKEGYSANPNGPMADGTKGKFVIRLGVSPLNGKTSPYKAPAGKEWRVMTASVYEDPTK